MFFRSSKIIFILGAVLLIYLSMALGLTIRDLAGNFRRYHDLWFALGGFCTGAYIFAFLNQFNSVYVFGHEFTHFIFAKLYLKNTGRMEITPTGGSVEVADSNFVIVLAPYIFPFYFLLFSGLYCVVLLIWKSPHPWFCRAAAAWLGACYAYHVVMTLLVLRKGQSDLRFRGFFFSICFIIAGNLFFFFLGEMFLAGNFSRGFSLLWNHIRWTVTALGWTPLCHYSGELLKYVRRLF